MKTDRQTNRSWVFLLQKGGRKKKTRRKSRSAITLTENQEGPIRWSSAIVTRRTRPTGRSKKRKTPRVRNPLARERDGGTQEGARREDRGLQKGGPARGGVTGGRVTARARRSPWLRWQRSRRGAPPPGRQDAYMESRSADRAGLVHGEIGPPPLGRGRQMQRARQIQRDCCAGDVSCS